MGSGVMPPKGFRGKAHGGRFRGPRALEVKPPQGDNIFLVKICSGRKSGTRLKEHKTEVESITSKPFTRNQRASSLSEQNKSAVTDHASHDNHVINWPASTILDRESDKSTR